MANVTVFSSTLQAIAVIPGICSLHVSPV